MPAGSKSLEATYNIWKANFQGLQLSISKYNQLILLSNKVNTQK